MSSMSVQEISTPVEEFQSKLESTVDTRGLILPIPRRCRIGFSLRMPNSWRCEGGKQAWSIFSDQNGNSYSNSIWITVAVEGYWGA